MVTSCFTNYFGSTNSSKTIKETRIYFGHGVTPEKLIVLAVDRHTVWPLDVAVDDGNPVGTVHLGTFNPGSGVLGPITPHHEADIGGGHVLKADHSNGKLF